MRRFLRLTLAVLLASLFAVVAIIIFSRMNLWLSIGIGVAWVASGSYAAARINKERVNVQRPLMSDNAEFGFFLCGFLALLGTFAWQILDVMVYGK